MIQGTNNKRPSPARSAPRTVRIARPIRRSQARNRSPIKNHSARGMSRFFHGQHFDRRLGQAKEHLYERFLSTRRGQLLAQVGQSTASELAAAIENQERRTEILDQR